VHWRRLLVVAETDHFSAVALRESLMDFDDAIANGNVMLIKLRLADVLAREGSRKPSRKS